MPLSMVAGLFTENYQNGTGRLFGVGRNQRYNRIPLTFMREESLLNVLSSAMVPSAPSCSPTVILFNDLPFGTGDFTGEFLQISNPRDSGVEVNVDRFSDYNFDNRAQSLLLVAAESENTIIQRSSFRDIFLNQKPL